MSAHLFDLYENSTSSRAQAKRELCRWSCSSISCCRGGKAVATQHNTRVDHLHRPHLLHPPPCGWWSTKCSGLLPPQSSLQQLHKGRGRGCQLGHTFPHTSPLPGKVYMSVQRTKH